MTPCGTGVLDWLRGHAAAREAAGLRRRLRPRDPAFGGLVDLASNDYLGLARDPRVVAGARTALETWGAGSTGSRLVTGSTRLHAQLEEELAAFVGFESALVFSSGYLANLGAVCALAGPGCLVVSDAQNHASLVDACRLSRARVVVVPHRDVAAVDRALAARAPAERAVVVTDAVFSVDGDLAPLAWLAAACRGHDALLVVDEAHALGVVGPGGRGALAQAQLAGAPDVVATATLSKSLGTQGGALLGSREVVDHAVDAGRTFIFDTGLAPACAGAALAALDVLRGAPRLAADARRRARDLATLGAAAGLRTTDPVAAVTSALVGAADAAVRAGETCRDHGALPGVFRPPSVPDGVSRLRLTARATLTDDDLAVVEKALAAVAEGLATAPPT
ncbi:MAG: 8-amino-7-oxononanoate synthase [Mycobacterium leprae]